MKPFVGSINLVKEIVLVLNEHRTSGFFDALLTLFSFQGTRRAWMH